jgi:AcrR family transcriptional regulator
MDNPLPLPVRLRLSSEERKASIVEAAKKLFAEKGFRGTTTREIAAAVGVTEPVLYEHFKTKRDLYSAIIDRCSSQGVELVEALAAKYAEADDDAGFFTELGATIVAWYTEDTSVIRLLLYSNLEKHEMRDLFFERQSNRFFDILVGYVQKRIDKGAIRAVNADLCARAFFGMIGHYSMVSLVFNCHPLDLDNREVIKGMVDIFLNGTCKRES